MIILVMDEFHLNSFHYELTSACLSEPRFPLSSDYSITPQVKVELPSN